MSTCENTKAVTKRLRVSFYSKCYMENQSQSEAKGMCMLVVCMQLRTYYNSLQMSHHMTKPTKWPVGLAKTRISLGICPVFAVRMIGPLTTHWAHSEDSDQTGWMPRLIWVFTGRTSFCWFCHDAQMITNSPSRKVRWLNYAFRWTYEPQLEKTQQNDLCAQWRLISLVSALVQDDLNLRWVHMSVCWFCHAVAHTFS